MESALRRDGSLDSPRHAAASPPAASPVYLLPAVKGRSRSGVANAYNRRETLVTVFSDSPQQSSPLRPSSPLGAVDCPSPSPKRVPSPSPKTSSSSLVDQTPSPCDTKVLTPLGPSSRADQSPLRHLAGRENLSLSSPTQPSPAAAEDDEQALESAREGEREERGQQSREGEEELEVAEGLEEEESSDESEVVVEEQERQVEHYELLDPPLGNEDFSDGENGSDEDNGDDDESLDDFPFEVKEEGPSSPPTPPLFPDDLVDEDVEFSDAEESDVDDDATCVQAMPMPPSPTSSSPAETDTPTVDELEDDLPTPDTDEVVLLDPGVGLGDQQGGGSATEYEKAGIVAGDVLDGDEEDVTESESEAAEDEWSHQGELARSPSPEDRSSSVEPPTVDEERIVSSAADANLHHEYAFEQPSPSPATSVSIIADSEAGPTPLPPPPPQTGHLNGSLLPTPTRTLTPTPSAVSPAFVRPSTFSSTPSDADEKRAGRLAYTAAAPTVKRQLSKQTSRPQAQFSASSAPPLGSVVRPTVVGRLAGKTVPGAGSSRIAVSSSSNAPSVPSRVASSPAQSMSALTSRLTKSTATSDAKRVGPASSKPKFAKPTFGAHAPPPSVSRVPTSTTKVVPPTPRTATDAAIPPRPGSAASNSSSSSLSASTSGVLRPRIGTGLKLPGTGSASLAAPSRIGGLRRVAAPRSGSLVRLAPGSSTISVSTSIPEVLADPGSVDSGPKGLALPSRRLLAPLAQTQSAPTLLQQPGLLSIANESRPNPAPSPRVPLPRPLASAPSPAKKALPPSPAKKLLPRPPPLEARVPSAPLQSPARLPRPPPLDQTRLPPNALMASPARLARPPALSSIANQARSPEKGKRPFIGTKVGSENVAPARTASTSTLPRSMSNPSFPTSRPMASPVKGRLASIASSAVAVPPPAPVFTASLLTAPADAVVGLEIFRPATVAPTPSSSSSSSLLKRPQPPVVVVENDVPPASDSRPTRRQATAPSTPANPLPRPTRKSIAAATALKAAEEAAALAPPPTEGYSVPAEEVKAPPAAFKPAPTLTQDQWSQLTQRNTRKNKQHFNKLHVDTVVMAENRPPSPTAKIRRSLGNEGAQAGTKEGRESRAAKRRSALRSSTDGSELGLERQEGIGEGEGLGAPLRGGHFRAAGDEEDYCSPVRKGKGKKRDEGEGERRSVKWDKALVYEGPVRPHGESDGILKRVPLDKYGNSLATSAGFAKPSAVTIVKRVYLDDEE